jgi:hypothetical protein
MLQLCKKKVEKKTRLFFETFTIYIYGQQTASLKTFQPLKYPERKRVRLVPAAPHKTDTSLTSLLSKKTRLCTDALEV